MGRVKEEGSEGLGEERGEEGVRLKWEERQVG